MLKIMATGETGQGHAPFCGCIIQISQWRTSAVITSPPPYLVHRLGNGSKELEESRNMDDECYNYLLYSFLKINKNVGLY